MGVYLCGRFQVSSIILTSFRQGIIYTGPPQNKSLKSSPRSGLKETIEIAVNQIFYKYPDLKITKQEIKIII